MTKFGYIPNQWERKYYREGQRRVKEFFPTTSHNPRQRMPTM